MIKRIFLWMVLLVCFVVPSVFSAANSAFWESLSKEQQDYLASHTQITVLYDPNWAPLEYRNEDGDVVGMAKEYLDLIAEMTGLTFVDFKAKAWKDGYELLLSGKIAMTTSLSPTKERERTLVFSKPYLTVPLAIIAGKQVGYIGSLAELEGKPIAVVRGYASREWILTDHPNLTVVEVDTIQQGLSLVQQGDAFCMVENLLVANHYLTNMGLTKDLKVVGNTPYVNTLSLAVHKDWAMLVPLFDKALKTISSEERDKIYSNHLPLYYEPSLQARTIYLIVGISILVLLVLLVWNWTLQRQMGKREQERLERMESERKFQQLFQSAPMPLVLLGFDEKILDANKAWLTTFGFLSGKIKDTESWYRAVYPEEAYRNKIQQQWNQELALAKEGKLEHLGPMECRLETQAGTVLTMEISGTILQDCLLITFFDITERKKSMEDLRHLHLEAEQSRKIILNALEDQEEAQKQLQHSNATLDAAINSMLDAVFILDKESRFILINQAFLAYFRFASRLECPPDMASFVGMFDAYHEDGTKLLVQDWAGNRALAGKRGSAEYTVVKNSTNERWIGSYRYAPIQDDKGNLMGAVVVCRDITEAKATEQELIFQRNHDYLTGLYSRVYFEQMLAEHRKTMPLSIGLLDINGLKLINDSFGNTMGDALLKKTAQLLERYAQKETILARYGGDEFVFLLPHCNDEEAEKFLRTVEEASKEVSLQSFQLSLSVGYASRTSSKELLQQVLKRSEDMMNRNKVYEHASAKNKSIALVINSLFAKSNRESLHSRRVSALCAFLATELNFPEREVNRMRVAGLMHDIGKIGVDEAILNKPQSLDEQEWEVMKRHPEIGYRILSASPEFNDLALAILQHHERWDGKGYPRGLAGKEISLQARIIMIADSYDAMTGERSYKQPMSSTDAIAEIKRCSGLQFDPALVDVFLASIDRFLKTNHSGE